MKKDIFICSLLGFTFVSVFGTLLHFLYEWIPSALTAAISGVNESTAEHMKIFYFPMLVFALLQRRFFKERRDFWRVKLKCLLLGLTLIPVLFYTYNGAVGKSPDALNIAIFFISAFLSFYLEARLFKDVEKKGGVRFFLLYTLIGVLFVIFTFYPPDILLFLDPVTNAYGI